MLQLTPYMTMMFEVEDLAVASPATVSRCGMVYMEPTSLGLQPLVNSWLDARMTDSFKANTDFVPTLKKLFDAYLEITINYVKRNWKEYVESVSNNLAQSLMRNINCFFDAYKETEYKKVP